MSAGTRFQFVTISAHDWRRSIRQARARVNPVFAAIVHNSMKTKLDTVNPWSAEPIDLCPVAPAYFIGHQEGANLSDPGHDLWNLTESIPGHPVGSTVSTQTLLMAGFELGPRVVRKH